MINKQIFRPVESKAQIENIINDLKKGETSAASEKVKTEEETKAEVSESAVKFDSP